MLRVVQKKAEVTKRKVSKHWQAYRTEKKRIMSLKRMPPEFKKGLIEEKLQSTRGKISGDWGDYRSYKYGKIHKSDIPGFSLVGKQTGKKWTDKQGITKYSEFDKTIHKIYKAPESFSENKWDKTISGVLERKNVLGVVAVLKVKNENDQIMYISDFITKSMMSRINAAGYNVFEHIGYKAKSEKSLEEFELVSYYMRVVYAKA